VGLLMRWQRDVETSAQLEDLRRKRDHLLELSMRQSQLGGAILFNQRLTKLHEDIEHTTQQLQDLRMKAKDVRQYRERVQRINEVAMQLERAVQEMEGLRDRTIDALRNRHIDNVTSAHQDELAVINRQLTEKRALEGIVQDLSKDHDDTELEHQALSLMADALSPTEGIIAEQLTGFIGCLTAQLNSIINSVWSYEMFVQPCGLDSGELDYKFPLQITTSDHVVDDIRNGSKAQQQIVNFAFQLTAMLYMEMTDYPLYLDEPGEGFDEQHRINLMTFVKQLMDADQHSQLFMISHYAATHGSLLSAQVLVLDSSNIAVPGEYNQHVVLS
jgi:DNA repair exonuclease SbcCD ATPase subunit